MNRSILYRSFLRCIAIQSQIVTVILFAMTIGARDSNGQSEQQFQFEGMIMSDVAIPSFVANTKLKGQYSDMEKTLKPLWTLKKLSLESRLKQTHSTEIMLRKRVDEAESQLEHWRKNIEDGMLHMQSKSSAFPLSRAAAEQLLIAAQLELQKVTWDLASEVALYKAISDAKDSTKSSTAEFEKRMSILESKGIEEDVTAAKKELEQVVELEKRGAISFSDAEKARQTVSKAMNALAIQQLRSQLVEAQQHAAKDARGAEIQGQIQKLTARKEQIEKYIGDLFKAMGELSSREQLLARVDRSEKNIATLNKLQDEVQVKMDEIEGLLEALNSVELEVKKE